ncbi:alpha/beta hydrolase fold domain-containing protein [Kaistella sp. G5-32]|uniref:Alpha/beta hydrolase fold domain-containing protein n=1 Tax=Kaistella gelatinilytica TaxID=2787636 RepID=A0ABS0FF31_9FLAO|nr:YqiA/YcfP family alpha/beta fold hydrolase [Kaistella gelatinilytica]MBF8458314.1 alpha/beta hydrolase fold domain-containing protein [Kaistella gelatinilytica]
MNKKLLYIHGLGSDRNSRKFVNIKEYFKDQFEYNFVEWKNNSNILSLLNEAKKWLESGSTDQIVLVGDSTGANFAYQLREKLKQDNIKTILLLTSPLLDISNRIRDIEFPKNLISQLWKIENPEEALIIATQKDEVLNLIPLYQKKLKNVELIDVDDSHRLLKFENYVPHIEKYIQSQT